jgi:citrate lyase beta subunit
LAARAAADRGRATYLRSKKARLREFHRIIAAFDLPENKDKGVVTLDGCMVKLHADIARRIGANR